MFFIFLRKLKKRKWTLLVLEEIEIDRFIFCIKHLTDLKPLVINSLEQLDFHNYEVGLYVYYYSILQKSFQNKRY